MAKKGVNLLDEDGEEKGPEEEGGEGERPARRARGGGGGGGLIRWVIIGVVAAAILGGGAWAGYQFWWIPSKKREEERLKAQQKLENLRKERLAKLRAEAEQRKQALAILQQVQAEQQGKAGGAPPKEGEKKPEAPAMAAKEPPQAPAMAKKEPAKPAMAKKEEPAKTAPKSDAAPRAAAAKPPAADGKRVPAREVKPPAQTAQMKPQEPAPEVKPSAPRPPRPAARRPAPAGGRAYSVQVATCRTDRCVQSFTRRLREKGMEAHVSGGPARSGPVNEVLLGSFASRAEADGLARRVRAKNLRATVYTSGGRWRVSAGSFRDLEDAAAMLDRAEDAGFRGELARRPGVAASGSGMRTVRTGSFATRQAALAERAKIVGVGFQGAFVVAEPRR